MKWHHLKEKLQAVCSPMMMSGVYLWFLSTNHALQTSDHAYLQNRDFPLASLHVGHAVDGGGCGSANGVFLGVAMGFTIGTMHSI